MKKVQLITKLVLCVFPLMLLTSCSYEQKLSSTNSNERYMEMFQLTNLNFDMFEITPEELLSLQEENFSGLVFVVRADCNYCHELVKEFNKFSLDSEKSITVKVLESDQLDDNQKENISLQFNLTSVPTILIFENGNIVATEIGIPTEERLIEIIKNI